MKIEKIPYGEYFRHLGSVYQMQFGCSGPGHNQITCTDQHNRSKTFDWGTEVIRDDDFIHLSRPRICKYLRDIIDHVGLLVAFDEAMRWSLDKEESAEEILDDILQSIIDAATEMGSLFDRELR